MSKRFTRTHLDRLRARLKDNPKGFLTVLTGPRQVGKTTMLLQLEAVWPGPCRYATADQAGSDAQSWLQTQWTLGRSDAAAHPDGAILLLDEIQQLEQWSSVVKALWDEDRREGHRLHVVLSGSSRLLLEKGLSESLAGRFEVLPMGHWTFPEMRDAFGTTWEDYVWFGAYPGAIPLQDNEQRWKQYIRTALADSVVQRDILQLTQVRKPALLRRLFDLGCRYSGQVLSYTKVLGQLQDKGNTVTLAHYLDLLDQAGMLAGLEKIDPAIHRQRASSPRFQVHNQALMSAHEALSREALQAQPERWGRWVESAVGAHLLADTYGMPIQIGYWRDSKHEVDLVVQHGQQLLALEIKSGPGRRRGGLDAYKKRYPEASTLLIGDSGIPIPEFVERPVGYWLNG
jgi:predicted AAA+ superfamily ATPase